MVDPEINFHMNAVASSRSQLSIIVLSDDLIKGCIPYACAEWNSCSKAAAKWSAFLNQEVCFLSKFLLVVCGVKIRMTLPTMIIMANPY